MIDDPTWEEAHDGRDRVLVEAHRCRLVDEGSCALISGTDIVLNLLGTSAEEERLRRDGYEVTFVARPVRAAVLAGALAAASRHSRSHDRTHGAEFH